MKANYENWVPKGMATGFATGAAALLVTHEREAAEYADRVLRMSDGVLTVE